MRLSLLIAALVFSGCVPSKPETTATIAMPHVPFDMRARERHLLGLEAILVRAGFPDVSRFYTGPEFSLVAVRVPGIEAIDSWRRLRQLVDRTNAWPVIIGEVEAEAALRDHIAESTPAGVTETIRRGERLDVGEWRRVRRNAYRETYAPPRVAAWKRAFRSRCPANDDFVIHRDLTSSKAYPMVSIVLVPTRESWQVPAFFQYGGWNDCPYPQEHVAVLRNWQERFGAEVLGLGSDIVELAVSRPIEDAQTALAVADEQLIYSYDIVHQGTITLDCLADELMGARAWFFWWD